MDGNKNNNPSPREVPVLATSKTRKSSPRNRCACGKVISRYVHTCSACDEKRRQANREIVAKGVCPDCGRGLKRNLALTGWWQCEQFGAVGFRKDSESPSCNFQTFA